MTAYKLHILLRYKIEKALIMGELAVTEIEAYWNNFIQEHFTCKPDSLKEGWLQDIHWTLGYFGYFPSYYLGLKLAQELWQEAESLNLTKRIEQGDFSGLREFLNKKIYSKAKLLSL